MQCIALAFPRTDRTVLGAPAPWRAHLPAGLLPGGGGWTGPPPASLTLAPFASPRPPLSTYTLHGADGTLDFSGAAVAAADSSPVAAPHGWDGASLAVVLSGAGEWRNLTLCEDPAPRCTQRRGATCTCPAHCFSCEGGACTRCRDGRFLRSGACLESCPAGLVSSGTPSSFGRVCLAPHECTGDRTVPGALPCTCDDPDCFSCSRSPAGTACARCRNGAFLHAGGCVASCAALNLSAYGDGAYGNECRRPFRCHHGYGCECPRSVGGANCARCDFTVAGVVCVGRA